MPICSTAPNVLSACRRIASPLPIVDLRRHVIANALRLMTKGASTRQMRLRHMHGHLHRPTGDAGRRLNLQAIPVESRGLHRCGPARSFEPGGLRLADARSPERRRARTQKRGHIPRGDHLVHPFMQSRGVDFGLVGVERRFQNADRQLATRLLGGAVLKLFRLFSLRSSQVLRDPARGAGRRLGFRLAA